MKGRCLQEKRIISLIQFSCNRAQELLILPHQLARYFETMGPKRIMQIHSHGDDKG
jgi:hypothetical protein